MFKNRKWMIVVAIFALSIAFVVTVRPGILPRSAGIEPGWMPPCDSKAVRELLVTAINASPAATQNGLRLIQVGDVSDLAHSAGKPAALDPMKSERFCLAVVYSNVGKDELPFSIVLDG